MKPKTEKEALDQCQLLWKEFANTGAPIREKYYTAYKVLGYLPTNACPACAWDEALPGRPCMACPVKAWRRLSVDDDFTNCVDYDSPYRAWQEEYDVDKRKEYAQQILQLIGDSKHETAQESG